jgi:hypothetical protein
LYGELFADKFLTTSVAQTLAKFFDKPE